MLYFYLLDFLLSFCALHFVRSQETITENSILEALDCWVRTIRNSDNIIFLKDGKVAEEGTHEKLLKEDGLYADMWNMQLHSTS